MSLVIQSPNIDADQLVSGILAAARIPGLDAGKIISGSLAVGRIPELIATGTYTGNNAAPRSIELGFQPAAVVVMRRFGSGFWFHSPDQGSYCYELVGGTYPASHVVAYSTGFYAYYGGSVGPNVSPATYDYIAWR